VRTKEEWKEFVDTTSLDDESLIAELMRICVQAELEGYLRGLREAVRLVDRNNADEILALMAEITGT
jgi:hypothetical protein